MRRLGARVPDYDYDADIVERPALVSLRIAEASAQWVPCTPEPGALVLLRNAPGVVNHLGVVVAPGRFLHTLIETGAYLVDLDNPLWRRRIIGFMRWNG
jgi:cell wall-associated NlpC family hydrolase